MQDPQPRFVPLATKTAACHTITYFVMGALAFHFLHYEDVINQPCSGMRPTTSLWVFMGPSLQVFRGILFASVFYPLRSVLFGRENGWAVMGWLLIGVGILGTFAAPAGSLEGFIYLKGSPLNQVSGYLEVVPQALLLSALLCYWVNHPEKKWLSWTLYTIFAICATLPILGLLAQKAAQR